MTKYRLCIKNNKKNNNYTKLIKKSAFVLVMFIMLMIFIFLQ